MPVRGAAPAWPTARRPPQRALSDALKSAFGDDPEVKYVNLGTAVDLRDQSIAYDGLHLVASGNERIARGLVAPVRELTSP